MGTARRFSSSWRGSPLAALGLLCLAEASFSLSMQEVPPEPAQELFDAALKLYDKGKYAQARRAFSTSCKARARSSRICDRVPSICLTTAFN